MICAALFHVPPLSCTLTQSGGGGGGGGAKYTAGPIDGDIQFERSV